MIRLQQVAKISLAATLLALSSSSRADTPRFDVVPDEDKDFVDCSPFDPKCGRRILDLQADAKFLTFSTEGGVTFDFKGGSGAAIKFSGQLVNSDTKSGSGDILMFDAAFVATNDHERAIRLRVALTDVEAVFFCKDITGGDVSIPLFNTDTSCKLGGIRSYLGVGGKVADVQFDLDSGRIAARWAEINAVLNILGNANYKDFLKKHLMAYAGASVDSIFYNDTPDAHGSKTLPRGNFGITGMIRTLDNHLEINGLAGYRPNFTKFSDYSLEARGQALVNILLAPKTLMQAGVAAQYQYNSVPANSFGLFVSDRDHHGLYVGAVLGFYFK